MSRTRPVSLVLIYLSLIVLAFSSSGCGMKTVTTHIVEHDADHFSESVNGKTVQFKNWQITVEGQMIEIPRGKSVITVENDGKHVRVSANGKQVFQD